MNTAQGTIYLIKDTKEVSAKFRVREFVLQLAGESRWPQLVSFQVTHEACETLDAFEVGAEVSLSFRLKGREWTPKGGGEVRYFNSLDAFDIDLIGESAPVPTDDEIPF